MIERIKICETCAYGALVIEEDLVCGNAASKHCAEPVKRVHQCPMWERKNTNCGRCKALERAIMKRDEPCEMCGYHLPDDKTFCEGCEAPDFKRWKFDMERYPAEEACDEK